MELKWERLDGRSGHDVGRALLKALVGELPAIAVAERGKPYFPEKALHFSISHCQTHAFCVISEKNIGLDAETVGRRADPRLAARILSPGEMARYTASPDPQDALLRIWVLKESYAKLTGRGWGNYLTETDFDPNDPRIQIIDGCYVAIMEEENVV